MHRHTVIWFPLSGGGVAGSARVGQRSSLSGKMELKSGLVVSETLKALGKPMFGHTFSTADPPSITRAAG